MPDGERTRHRWRANTPHAVWVWGFFQGNFDSAEHIPVTYPDGASAFFSSTLFETGTIGIQQQSSRLDHFLQFGAINEY